jgi:hypothetical protein
VVEHGENGGVIVHCASMHLRLSRGQCHQVGGGGPFGPVAAPGCSPGGFALDCTESPPAEL